ncbi:MAG TPA: membrane protein insertase YidC [Acidobacteriaceae bacterium]|nr:membrane protein insertase YidC [Acidobacteriaceae bacterium]
MAEIQNPNQQSGGASGGGGGGDMRSLFGFMVVFLIMVIAFQYFSPKKPEQVAQQQKSQPAQTQPSAPAPVPASAGSTPQPASGHGHAAPADAAAVQSSAESDTVVENELYRITFTNRGGAVKSWLLKKYKDDTQKAPLDLVNHAAAAKFGLPLSLFTYDASLKNRLNSSLYVPSQTGTVSVAGSGSKTLTFDYSYGGLVVRKTFHFDSSYVIGADFSVTQNGAPVTALLAWPSGLGDQTTLQGYAGATFASSQNGKTDETAAKKVVGGDTLRGSFDYAGVSDLYFAAVFMPTSPADTAVVTQHETLDVPKNPEHPDPKAVDQMPLLGAAVGSVGGGAFSTRLFVGPKLLDLLDSVHTTTGENLEHVVSFGWWGWIAKPMLLVLRFFVTHGIPNWGWAILILTLILNVAMLPTRVMMMKSSLKMQRIQPQMDAIKAKYAKYKTTDPRRQEMNKEMFDLQRKEGVNMFGGCLPMLLQYPLLFGFYRMLEYAIELRQAHWLWLTDLSAPDAMHILPLSVIVSMFLSQFFTPSPGMDQKQQRMMAFMMPAVFGVMMWNIGSGVALYWAGSNLLGVATQMVMNRTSMGVEMRAIAAKRAAKRGAKTINARR